MKWRSVRVLSFCFLLVGILAVATTTANAASKKFADCKVKKVTVKKATGTYKSWDWSTKKKDYVVEKFKYTKGYNLTWKKIKGATGYKITIYRYSPVRKKYVIAKTKNVKKPKYLLTDLVKGEKYKYTIQAYKGTSTNRKYSKCSGKFTLKAKGSYDIIKTDKNHNIINEPEYDRFEAEKAFVIQNKYRQEKGIAPLKWSEELYNVAMKRCEERNYIGENNLNLDPHKRPDGKACEWTFREYFGEEKWNKYCEESGYSSPYSENWSSCTLDASEVMESWKKSKGHYDNLLNEDWTTGAIAAYYDGNGVNWYSVFSRCVIE